MLDQITGRVLALDFTQREGGQGAHLGVAVFRIAIRVEHINEAAESAWIADARQRQHRAPPRAAMPRLQHLDQIIRHRRPALVFVLNDLRVEGALRAVAFERWLA